ncbi:CAP domain-containing protein [Carnobacterium gallinarum]|uniref:CAP domain-containing protein n=1 Tax=Carnobacterium gallinarum TaxID=2749 RepID=UPI00054DE65A|nr:CAP domain-containing protein [Carnobacterium gallinarum]
MRIIKKLISLVLLITISLGIGYYFGTQNTGNSVMNQFAEIISKSNKTKKEQLVSNVTSSEEEQVNQKEIKNSDLAIIEAKIHKLVNEERVKQGVPALVINQQLVNASRQRSKEIVTDFSHERDGESSFSIFKEPEYSYVYQAVGENIVMATYQGTPEDMGSYFFKLWKESPGHYENMISPKFTEVGTGIYLKDGLLYGTQLFGNPRK